MTESGEKFFQKNGQEPVKKERTESAEKLTSYLRHAQKWINQKLKEMSIQGKEICVAEDVRIIPQQERYQKKDQEFVRTFFMSEYNTVDESVIERIEQDKKGFKFEILKTAIMHRNLKSRYLVMRSSRFDDIKNGVDNVIVNRETGDIVCALDEISSNQSGGDTRLEQKRREIRSKNFGTGGYLVDRDNAGAKLSYGIEIEGGVAEQTSVSHLPIFLLSLDDKRLDKGMETFDEDSNKEKSAGYELQLYIYFLSVIDMQIKDLKLDLDGYWQLPLDFKKRVESFELFIKEELRNITS